MSKFNDMLALDVSAKVEKKKTGNATLSYLSWAYAWGEFKKVYEDATYKIIKNNDGLPYFIDEAGAMCYTTVTANGETQEMWLPVMDGANKPMKKEAYNYKTKYAEKTCAALNMFDVNKTVMRCLVKNLAMFGLGLYIYAGEDLPSEAADPAMRPEYFHNLISVKLGEIMADGVAKEHISNSVTSHLKVSKINSCKDLAALREYHDYLTSGKSSLVQKQKELNDEAEKKEKELAEKDAAAETGE